MSGRLPVFYTPRMVARPKTFSPSAAKPVAEVDHQAPVETDRLVERP